MAINIAVEVIAGETEFLGHCISFLTPQQFFYLTL